MQVYSCLAVVLLLYAIITYKDETTLALSAMRRLDIFDEVAFVTLLLSRVFHRIVTV